MTIVSIMMRSADVRLTPQRQAVLNALRETVEWCTPIDLFQRLRSDGSTVGLATVYRALTALVHAGLADTVRDETGQQLFHAGPAAHPHHHLSCRVCGRTVRVDTEPVVHWAAETAARHGFSESEPLIRLTGQCPLCASASDPPSTD